MTHEDLLDFVNKDINAGAFIVNRDEWFPGRSLLALRAVVELHKPKYLGEALEGGPEYSCKGCEVGTSGRQYPCPTIEAIEKELSNE